MVTRASSKTGYLNMYKQLANKEIPFITQYYVNNSMKLSNTNI